MSIERTDDEAPGVVCHSVSGPFRLDELHDTLRDLEAAKAWIEH